MGAGHIALADRILAIEQMAALEHVPYHGADIPHVGWVAPWSLEHDLGRPVDVGLGVVVALHISVHGAPEVAEDDPAPIFGKAKRSGHVNRGTIDDLSGRGCLHLFLHEVRGNLLVSYGVQDVVGLDVCRSMLDPTQYEWYF